MSGIIHNSPSISGIKPNLGQHFTPKAVGRLMVSQIPLKEPSLVVDLCSGTGELLWSAKQKWPKCKIVGCDIDNELVAQSQKRFASSGRFQCLNILDSRTRSETTLLSEMLENGGADVLLANPPFGLIAEEGLDPDLHEILIKHDLMGSSGKEKMVRAEVAFLVRNIQFLSDFGYIGALLPESVLSGIKNEPFRKYLSLQIAVKHVVSLPLYSFSSCEARISFLIAKKIINRPKAKRQVSVSTVDKDMKIDQTVNVDQSRLIIRMDPKYHIARFGNRSDGGARTTIGMFIKDCARGYGIYSNEHNIITNRQKDIIYLHSTCVRDFLIDRNSHIQKRIPVEFAERHHRAIVRNSDLLVVRVGKGCAGRCCIVTGLIGKGFISDCLYVLKGISLDPYYLCLFLNTAFAKKMMNSFRRGICSEYITKNDLMNLPLFLPPESYLTRFSDDFRYLTNNTDDNGLNSISSDLRVLVTELDNLITSNSVSSDRKI